MAWGYFGLVVFSIAQISLSEKLLLQAYSCSWLRETLLVLAVSKIEFGELG
jgi:hypothetical protein